MARFPCTLPPLACGSDLPYANLSSEREDRRKFFAYAFFGNFSMFCESEVSQALADVCVPIPPNDPPLAVIYSSNARMCAVPCGVGSQSYTVAAGTFVSSVSQDDADQKAFAFACVVAAIICTGPPPTIYTSTAQSCTVNCLYGGTYTYVTPEGFFSALSQAEANAQAFDFACVIAALSCAGGPPTGDCVLGACPPPDEPAKQVYGNFTQTCVSVCVDGSQFTAIVPAGSFYGYNRAEANAVAKSYACIRAQQQQVCLGNIAPQICLEDFYDEAVNVTGLQAPVTIGVVSGAMPPGIVLEANDLVGEPTTAAAYNFTLRATGADGTYVQKAYTINVSGITTDDDLPDADLNEEYTPVNLASAGLGAEPLWEIESGSLPDGMSLNPTSGIIFGTPTEDGDFVATISVTGNGFSCEKTFFLTVESVSTIEALAWISMNNPSPNAQTDSVTGNPVTGVDGSEGASASVAGKVSLAVDIPGGGSGGQYLTGPQLQYTGNGMTICGWFNMPFDSSFSTVLVEYLYGPTDFIRFTTNPLGGPNCTFGDITVPRPVEGVWHFFAGTYDPTDGKFRLYLNADPVVVGAGVFVIPPTVFAGASLFCPDNTATYCIYDEIALFNGAINQSQYNYLRNGGAGRAYPVTLP